MRAAYDATRRGGTACIIGVGGMDKTVSFNAFELFFDEKTLKGSYYGSADVRSDFSRMLNLWKHGRLDLEGMISKKIHIDDVNDAVEDLKAGTVIRSVITFDDAASGAAAAESASTHHRLRPPRNGTRGPLFAGPSARPGAFVPACRVSSGGCHAARRGRVSFARWRRPETGAPGRR